MESSKRKVRGRTNPEGSSLGRHPVGVDLYPPKVCVLDRPAQLTIFGKPRRARMGGRSPATPRLVGRGVWPKRGNLPPDGGSRSRRGEDLRDFFRLSDPFLWEAH